jgi:hypothetical protein
MTEQITSAEMTKAAHNLERLAEFVGVRRRWTVEQAGHSAAVRARKAGETIAEVICQMTGGEIATPVGVENPSALEPSGEIAAGRLARFADYLDQLCRWFEAHSNSQLPPETADSARSIQRSLAATGDALRQLLEERAPEPKPEPEKPAFTEPEPLTRADLGPVVEVDANARLILDHTWQNSLLQKRGNIMELTPATVKKLDEFFSDQNFELNSHERRRLYEKVQRWVESTPNKRVLVLRMSGLSGKPDVLSSFQPKEDEDDPAAVAPSMYGSAAIDRLAAQTPPGDIPATQPAAVAPEAPAATPQTPAATPQTPAAAPQAPVVDPEEEFVLPDPIEDPKKKSPLEEYFSNPPSGVIPKTIAPPLLNESSEKDTKDDD